MWARTCVTHIFLWTTLSLHLFIVGEGLEKPLTHRQEQNIANLGLKRTLFNTALLLVQGEANKYRVGKLAGCMALSLGG